MVKFELETRNQITVGSGQFEERPMFYIIFGNFGFSCDVYVQLWALVSGGQQRSERFFELFRILRLDICRRVSATLVTVSWNETQETGLAWK